MAHFGDRLRAEDSRRAARARAARRIPKRASDRPRASRFRRRWWRYRQHPSGVRHEVLGVHRRRGAARGRTLEEYWRRLGFVVIQGYGLTETAPIVTLNHPFKTNKGSVGKPIAGVEIRRLPRTAKSSSAERTSRPGITTPGSGTIAEPGSGGGSGVRRRRRVASYRRHRGARRARASLHQGPEEGNDRHAGRAERLSGGRRAAAERAAGVIESAVVGTRAAEGSEERVHAGTAARSRSRWPKPSSERPTPILPITNASAVLHLERRSSASNRRHQEAQTRAIRRGWNRRGARAASQRRSLKACSRVRGLPSARRRHVARGAGPELARARRS